MISGLTASCSDPNIRPVLPNPVITSSTINKVSVRLHHSRTALSVPGGQRRIPAAPWISGGNVSDRSDPLELFGHAGSKYQGTGIPRAVRKIEDCCRCDFAAYQDMRRDAALASCYNV